MKKGKSFLISLLLALSLMFTGCSQEMLDRVTESVVEQAREDAAWQAREDSVQQPLAGEEEQPALDQSPTAAQVSVSADRYAYQSLNQTVRQVYNEVYAAMLDFVETADVSTADSNVLQQAYYAVMADHGEIFWVEGYSYTEYTRNNMVVRLEFHPKFTMDEARMQSYQKQVDVKVNEILSGISAGASDYEKAKYVYETLASTVTYQTDSQNNQNILSVFINGITVCQGYATATQYLLSRLGVTCATVSGTASGTPHAWNLVCLDGKYYYMDTTWGSGSYSAEQGGGDDYVDFSYFAVTSQELLQTHKPNNDYPLPVCNSTADNYYVRENLYYTEWDTAAIGEGIKSQTDGTVSLKFSSAELYNQALKYYIEDGHLWDYYSSDSSVYYIENSQMRVLTVFSGET